VRTSTLCRFTVFDDILDSKLGSPSLWSTSYESLENVTPGFDLCPQLLDFYLLQESYSIVKGMANGHHVRHAYYLDLSTVKNLLNHTLVDDIRKTILCPAEEPIRKHPVLFLLVEPGSKRVNCLILFDYSKEEVFVFVRPHGGGPRETNMLADWSDWTGDQYWRAIAVELGWSISTSQPKVIQPNWNQVKSNTHKGCASVLIVL
jgi:hypothetical protein